MRQFLVGALVTIASASSAHAMGVYTNLDLVAWNADGSAALIARTTSSSGATGTDHDLLVVIAGQKPVVVAFEPKHDGEAPHPPLTQKQCEAEADKLDKVLREQKFTSITVARAKCATDRKVVSIAGDNMKVVEQSWVAMPGLRTPTAREALAIAAVKDLEAPFDVAAKTGKLAIVLFGTNGDDSSPAHGTAFAGGKAFVADLRYAQ